jgi:hypothetical protein
VADRLLHALGRGPEHLDRALEDAVDLIQIVARQRDLGRAE